MKCAWLNIFLKKWLNHTKRNTPTGLKLTKITNSGKHKIHKYCVAPLQNIHNLFYTTLYCFVLHNTEIFFMLTESIDYFCLLLHRVK